MADRELQVEIGVQAMRGLLEEFRAGNIGRRDIEKDALQEHMAELSRRWDERFPGLPEEQSAYSSLKGISRRGGRDGYLKGIIVKALEDCETAGMTIVNPA